MVADEDHRPLALRRHVLQPHHLDRGGGGVGGRLAGRGGGADVFAGADVAVSKAGGRGAPADPGGDERDRVV